MMMALFLTTQQNTPEEKKNLVITILISLLHSVILVECFKLREVKSNLFCFPISTYITLGLKRVNSKDKSELLILFNIKTNVFMSNSIEFNVSCNTRLRS